MKSYKQLVNEVLTKMTPLSTWIDDFIHSKNAKFAGKTTAERIKMAKGAYYAAQRNESAAASQNSTAEVDMREAKEHHLVHVSDGSGYDETPHEKDIEHIKTGAMHTGGQWHGHSDKGAFFKFKSKEDAEQFKRHVDKCPHKSCYADHVNEAVEYKGIGTDVVDKKKKLNPQPNLMSDKKQVKDFKEEVKKPTGDLKKACWKGYTAVGLKMKDGRKVPNCVPEEVQVEEGKVYDPITKKMVATKPIKVQAGGGATRNGVPVETGPSKYKQGLKTEATDDKARTKRDYTTQATNNLSHTLHQVGKDKWHIYDTKTREVHSTYNNKNVAMKKYGELNDKHAGYETAGGIVKGKYGVRKEELEQIQEIGDTEKGRETLKDYRQKANLQKTYTMMKPSAPDALKDRQWKNRNIGTSQATKRLAKEEVEQIDEVSKSTLVSYIDKASQDVHDKAMAAGSHHAGKSYKDFMANYAKSGKRQAGITKAAVKLAKEEVEQIEEATVATRKYDFGTMKTIHHGKSFSIPLHPEHHQPIAKLKHGESHSFKDETGAKWKATRDNDTVHFHGGSYGTQKTSVPHSSLQESRGHKVLATFFKNREVAQRAYQGNPAKDAEVAQGGGTPADQGIAAAKKDAEKLKKESVNPALMAILKKRQEAQKKKEEDKKKVSESKTPAVHAAEPKKTKSTAKEYTKASVPGTKRVAHAKPDDNEVGGGTATRINEDQYTSEYKIKYYVDPVTGENKTRKIRPHRVNFKASKMHGEPAQQDALGDYGMKEGYVAEGGFDNYHEIAKELIKRHGKNVDTGHINDLAGERDTHRGLDHSEVMHHVNKILGSKEVKEGDEYDEQWKEYKGKTFKKESRMINFKDYLKEAHLSAKQKKIAAIAGDKDKIDADDLAALRAGKKPVEEAKKCMDEDDMDESGLRMAAHAAHKSGKKEFEFQGKTYPVKVQKEEVEQIDEVGQKNWTAPQTNKSGDSKAVKDTDSAALHAYNQDNLEKHLRKHIGDKKGHVYFDDADLVHFDKTVVRNAIHPKSKHTVGDLKSALDKHVKGVKEEVQIDEAKYGIDVHRNKLSKLLTHASNAGIKAKVVSHNPNWEKQNAGGEHVVHLHGKDEHVRKFIQKHHDNDPQATDDYKEYGKSVKEEVEQIDELSKKTLGSYVNKAAKDSRIHGQIATDFENTADKARKQSKRDSFERLNRKYLEKAWKREDGIAKAVGKLTKEEVALDEGRMKELAMDLKDMSHDEFHKQYGKPKSHYDSTNFKKPVQPGQGMERARALAQRGLQSVLSKEEVERIEEKLEQIDEISKKTAGSYVQGRVDDLTDKSMDDDSHEHSHIKAKHLQGIDRAAKRLGDKNVAKHAKSAIDHAKDFAWQYHHNMDDYHAVHAQDNMDDSKAKLSKAVDKASKKSKVKEEVEQIDELSGKTLGSYHQKARKDVRARASDLLWQYGVHHGRDIEDAASEDEWDKDTKADAEKDLAKRKQRDKGIDLAAKKLAKKASANESVEQQMSPYVKGTLAVMDEGKIDDLRDAQKLRKDTQSAYSKGYKPDTSHPHIQVVKGTAYGGANQKDDEGDEKKDDEGQEKRGRGRPAGKVGKYKARGSKSVDKDIDDREFTLHLPK